MPKIILISGKKRSGKDTFAKLLQNKLITRGKVKIMHFAFPMKSIIADMFGISLNELESYKNEEINISFDNYSISFRKILQRFGNGEIKRFFGKDVWAKMLYGSIDRNYDYIIVPDFRFPEEYKKTDDNDIVTVMIESNRIEHNDNDISENALNDWKFDFVVDNNGTIDDLEKEVDRFIIYLDNI